MELKKKKFLNNDNLRLVSWKQIDNLLIVYTRLYCYIFFKTINRLTDHEKIGHQGMIDFICHLSLKGDGKVFTLNFGTLHILHVFTKK